MSHSTYFAPPNFKTGFLFSKKKNSSSSQHETACFICCTFHSCLLTFNFNIIIIWWIVISLNGLNQCSFRFREYTSQTIASKLTESICLCTRESACIHICYIIHNMYFLLHICCTINYAALYSFIIYV